MPVVSDQQRALAAHTASAMRVGKLPISRFWDENRKSSIYTPDRKGIHPQQHLAAFAGTLQADAYGGYQAIYETGRVLEAACWAHARRQIYELHAARPNAFNTEALERIGALYKIEDEGLRALRADCRMEVSVFRVD